MNDELESQNRIVDCRGLLCPMPILQVRLALNRMQTGEVLEILADDPTFTKDFAQFCQLAEIEWTNTEAAENYTRYWIRVN